MEKKNPTQKRNERPNLEEEERADKGGLKTETKSQGLKSDATKLPETDPEIALEESEDAEADVEV
ncbi:MAG: hypothetical protein JST89_23380 [Cyanobacteria bacterium SZAS-4]|nr:hypothetical protein [Cyanobacteria bacterium SZAS-4]